MCPKSIYHANHGKFGRCIRLNLFAVNDLLAPKKRLRNFNLTEYQRRLLQKRYTAYIKAGGRVNFDTGVIRSADTGKKIELPAPLNQLPSKEALRVAQATPLKKKK